MKISVTVITLNEEDRIADRLDSLQTSLPQERTLLPCLCPQDAGVPRVRAIECRYRVKSLCPYVNALRIDPVLVAVRSLR